MEGKKKRKLGKVVQIFDNGGKTIAAVPKTKDGKINNTMLISNDFLNKLIFDGVYQGDKHKLAYDVGQSKKKLEEGTTVLDFDKKSITRYTTVKQLRKEAAVKKALEKKESSLTLCFLKTCLI